MVEMKRKLDCLGCEEMRRNGGVRMEVERKLDYLGCEEKKSSQWRENSEKGREFWSHDMSKVIF